MNKSIKYLVLAAMAVSANVSAHTQQTYLNLRSSNVNLPMENTTFYERTQMKLEGRFGGNLQVTGFYGETHNDFGSYFGINDKSKFTLGTDADVTAKKADYGLEKVLNGNKNTATVSLDPKSKSYGARFDYYQNMDKLLKGLYLKVNTTVVHVENEMGLSVDSSDAATKTALQKYFKGEDTGIVNQEKLTHALIDGEHSETGLADIDVILGYKFLYKNKYHFGINLAITIPTGNDADGDQVFEPVYGNHSHFGFGGGLDAHTNLWTKGEQNIKLNFMANYRYLFESSENRIFALKGEKYAYTIITKDGKFVPAPNVLTHDADVTPGSQFDGILALAYNNGGLSFDLGYNMYYKEEEDVNFKGDLATGYKFDGKDLTKEMIETEVAATPSQFSNGIYGGLGYHFKKWDYPLLMGVGGKYDWGNENSCPDNWSVWLKLALSF